MVTQSARIIGGNLKRMKQDKSMNTTQWLGFIGLLAKNVAKRLAEGLSSN